MWICEIDNVQALLIRYQQMLLKMMNILIYTSHNIIYLQGLQNTMEGILEKLANNSYNLILYFHVRINDEKYRCL